MSRHDPNHSCPGYPSALKRFTVGYFGRILVCVVARIFMRNAMRFV